MDLEGIMLMKSKKQNKHNKTEIESQMQKTNLWLQGEKVGRDKLGDRD